MRKILTLLAVSAIATASMAQDNSEDVRRGRIQNMTDYSQPVVSRQRRVGSRTTAPLPCTGSPKIPVILVQFDDTKFTADVKMDDTIEHSDENVNAFYNKFCNGTGIPGKPYRPANGSWGSVSDYFIEQSDSLFSPEFEVIGPVTLSRGYAYYGEGKNDNHINEFYSEACKIAVQNHSTDWSAFDNNGDGKVDLVYFIYAGGGANVKDADINLIWPKEQMSSITVKYDGGSVVFASSACCNELYKSTVDGIGTMCHELSHGLGLPDFYDTSYNAFGLDYWDLMDSGSYQLIGKEPCCYSGYEREFMGWRKMEEVAYSDKKTLTLQPIESGGVSIKIANPANENEYFILENRQNIGFDTHLGCATVSGFSKFGAAHGLIIFHVDYSASSWTSNGVNSVPAHQRFTIVPADGKLIKLDTDTLSNESFRADLYPGANNITAMSNYSVFTGGEIDMTITDITENEDKTITLKLNGGDPIVDAISDIPSQNTSSSAIYDLTGRMVAQPKKGIYIINGKKVFIR